MSTWHAAGDLTAPRDLRAGARPATRASDAPRGCGALQPGEQVAHDASHLQEQFETLVPYGYENDAGGFGDVVLDVRKRKITVERNDRFEDYSTTTYEV